MQSSQIRKQMRTQRLMLTPQQLKRHSQHLHRNLCNHKYFRHSRRIAFYIACRGEMELTPALQSALTSRKQVYLPVLTDQPANRMRFAAYRSGDPLIMNRFGIPEPVPGRTVTSPAWALDAVLVPLLAFDDAGNRLGMGGGYYDRTFAFKQQRRCWQGPKLIGIAHAFQRVDRLIRQPWDIPLDAVITDAGIYHFNRSQT